MCQWLVDHPAVASDISVHFAPWRQTASCLSFFDKVQMKCQVFKNILAWFHPSHRITVGATQCKSTTFMAYGINVILFTKCTEISEMLHCTMERLFLEVDVSHLSQPQRSLQANERKEQYGQRPWVKLTRTLCHSKEEDKKCPWELLIMTGEQTSFCVKILEACNEAHKRIRRPGYTSSLADVTNDKCTRPCPIIL